MSSNDFLDIVLRFPRLDEEIDELDYTRWKRSMAKQ